MKEKKVRGCKLLMRVSVQVRRKKFSEIFEFMNNFPRNVGSFLLFIEIFSSAVKH